jgi:hypothetical protein
MKYRIISLVISLLFITSNSFGYALKSALIVTQSTWSDKSVDPLLGTIHDVASAKKMAHAMGIKDEDMVILRDSEATKARIMQELSNLNKNAAEGGKVFIYFSGHGSNWLDMNTNQCKAGMLTNDMDYITNAELANATKRILKVSDKTIVMLDTCFSNGIIKGAGSRALSSNSNLKAKFAPLNSKITNAQCNTPINADLPANVGNNRGFGDATSLGAIQENYVLISTAKENEASWDSPISGGIGTQSVRDCLLGEARDLNGSGGISLEEIRACAQAKMDYQMRNQTNGSVSHLTIKGNRNLIPVPNPQPPATDLSNNENNKPPIQPPTSKPPPVSPPPVAVNPPPVNPPAKPPVQPPPPAPIVPPPVVDDRVASLETMKDILAQSNPEVKVNVTLASPKVKIGTQAFNLSVNSSKSGYVYVLLLGSDRKSFYILYPNKLASNNQIKENETITLPGENWKINASGPTGIDNILVMVSETARDFSSISQMITRPNSPFAFTLNDIKGRQKLVSLLTDNNGENKGSSRYGATLIKIEEY